MERQLGQSREGTICCIGQAEGLKIDPETAEVCWEYAQVADPYGVYPDLPEECHQARQSRVIVILKLQGKDRPRSRRKSALSRDLGHHYDFRN